MFNPVTLKLKSLFQFRPDRGLSEDDPDYNWDPSEKDKVHVLVFVLPANTAGSLSDGVLQKIKEIRKEARDLGKKISFTSHKAVTCQTFSPCNSALLKKFLPFSMSEIPQVTIFTKVDEFSPEIKEDLKKVYRDENLKEKVGLSRIFKKCD